MVTLMADAGVGKTRLVRELWERLGAESPEPLRRTGRCLAYGHGITYWPLGEILKEHLGILESDSPETVHERLGPPRDPRPPPRARSAAPGRAPMTFACCPWHTSRAEIVRLRGVPINRDAADGS